MIREVKVKKGFTIIELMLAMSAVAGLMIAVAGLIIQMTNTITRGTTYRDLNAASRTINVDLTKTLNSPRCLKVGMDLLEMNIIVNSTDLAHFVLEL